MASNDRGDIQLSAVAAGFTIGFGFLTVWEAIKQTRRNRNPLRSVYIYMIWGEILANITIGVIGWVFLDGIIGPTSVPLHSVMTYTDRKQYSRSVLHPLLLDLRNSTAHANHHKPYCTNRRTSKHDKTHKMGDRGHHHCDQHCSLLHMDPGTLATANKSAVCTCNTKKPSKNVLIILGSST